MHVEIYHNFNFQNNGALLVITLSLIYHITTLQLYNKQHVLFSQPLAWQARTISIWSATNNEANTSENDSMFSFISFWHSSSLNTNKQTRIIHEDNKRRQAARRFPSRRVRTNTMTQKYASRASAVYIGIKIFHHDRLVTPSSRSTRSTLNMSSPIKWSQISNTESPSHRTTSSSVRNMLGYIKQSYIAINIHSQLIETARKQVNNNQLLY